MDENAFMKESFDNGKIKNTVRFVLTGLLILLPFICLIKDSMAGNFPFTRYKGYAVCDIRSLHERPVFQNLRKGTVIQADYIADVVEPYSIQIRYKCTGKNHGYIRLNVYDKANGKKIGSWDQDLSELHGEQIILYPFDYLGYERKREKKSYTLEIIGSDGFNRAKVALNKNNNKSETMINGKRSKHGLQFAVAGISDDIPLVFPKFWLQLYFCVLLAIMVYNSEAILRSIKKKQREA